MPVSVHLHHITRRNKCVVVTSEVTSLVFDLRGKFISSQSVVLESDKGIQTWRTIWKTGMLCISSRSSSTSSHPKCCPISMWKVIVILFIPYFILRGRFQWTDKYYKVPMKQKHMINRYKSVTSSQCFWSLCGSVKNNNIIFGGVSSSLHWEWTKLKLWLLCNWLHMMISGVLLYYTINVCTGVAFPTHLHRNAAEQSRSICLIHPFIRLNHSLSVVYQSIRTANRIEPNW